MRPCHTFSPLLGELTTEELLSEVESTIRRTLHLDEALKGNPLRDSQKRWISNKCDWIVDEREDGWSIFGRQINSKIKLKENDMVWYFPPTPFN